MRRENSRADPLVRNCVRWELGVDAVATESQRTGRDGIATYKRRVPEEVTPLTIFGNGVFVA